MADTVLERTPSFDQEIALTLLVCVGALALFVSGRFRVELVGLLVMVALIVLGLITPEQAVAGFSNPATVTVGLMLALSVTLVRTGAVDLLGAWIQNIAAGSELRMTVAVIVIVVPVSAFLNNTAAVAILLPMVMGLSRRSGSSPSRLLMPLSFCSQMGGTLTLIGTSTNLIVAGVVLQLDLPALEIFDITGPAAVLMVIGVLYMLTVGRWLVPRREVSREPLMGERLRDYLTEMTVRDGSSIIGATLEESRIEDTGVRVVGVIRGGERVSPDDPGFRFESRDRVLVRGATSQITELESDPELILETTAAELGAREAHAERRIGELIVAPASRAAGLTTARLLHGIEESVDVLAIQRHGVGLSAPLRSVRLRPGDVLLVRAPREWLRWQHELGDFALLGIVDVPRRRTDKMKIALPVMAAVVLAAALDVAPIMVTALFGMAAMLLTGCVRATEVYDDMDWGVVLVLGSLLSLGIAMERTGTAHYLAAQILGVTGELGPYVTLAAMYLLTSLLTELITNNASALVLTPIAVAVGRGLDVSPLPFVLAVMFAASNSFMTPVGYQTNTFIYSPGGYRFTDFTRVGAPLVLLMTATATAAIPVFFPF